MIFLINTNETVNNLNTLYDYGEIKNNDDLNYLVDLKFINEIEGRLVITKKWAKYSGKISREDFISSMMCYYPTLLNVLLLKVYKEASIIGNSGDGEALFEFINSIPAFANEVIKMKENQANEDQEIKSMYQVVFNEYPQYQQMLNKLKLMQMVEDVDDLEMSPMGNNPNEIWTKGRRITSSIDIQCLKQKNVYTLTPYDYNDFSVEKEIKGVLCYPWETFLTVLGLMFIEYKTIGCDVVSVRPTDLENGYNDQSLDLYIFDIKGNEIKVESLNNFAYEFCLESNFCLFPDKAPELDKVVFKMMNEKKIDFKDGEYILNEEFKDLIYSKDIIIKNRSRKLKNMLKDYIEKLRKAL